MLKPVSITDKALAEVKHILANKNIPANYGLRISVKGSGCGVAFTLGFDTKKDNDLEYDVDGVTVYVQKKETLFLVGKQVDFYEGADARGFVFLSESANK